VAVHGLGGLGHWRSSSPQIWLPHGGHLTRKEKEALAYQLGASTYIDAEATDAAAELKKLGGRASSWPPLQQQSHFWADQWSFDRRPGNYRGLVERADANSPWQLLGEALGQRLDCPPARNSSEDTLKFSVMAGIVPMIESFRWNKPAWHLRKAVSKVHSGQY